MRVAPYLRFFLHLLAVAFATAATSSLSAAERVRIVAANLTSGNGQDYDPGHGNRILRGLRPDIVLVQELNYLGNTSADIRSWVDTNFGASFSYVRETNPGQIPNGIVSRYPILASGSWTDANVSNRKFVWARIDVPGDKDLWAISVHLLTTSSSNRNAEAVQILNYIAAQGIPASDYVTLGGDFNTDSRSESALGTLSKYFTTSGPWPVDQAGNGNTNAGRSKPYDWVLADADLHALRTPVVLGSNTFPNGLVFDSRVYSPLLSPVLAGDSAATNMQHMAVVRDFLIPSTTSPSVPAIFSTTTAGGVVGQSFTYQIAATQTPTSYGASGLPAGLGVNTATGLISGTPTTAGSTSVTLSATNASGTGTATLVLTVTAPGGGGTNGTIFSENMGVPTGTTAISDYATGTAPATFQNQDTLTFGQGDQASPADVRSTSVSSGYTDASANGNVWFTATDGTRGFSIENINASAHTGLNLVFGYRKELASAHVALSVDFWNGSAWQTLANTSDALFNESATAGTGWYRSKTLALPAAAQINGLKIRFVKTGTLAVRIDDVKLTGTPAATSTLAAVGPLAAVDTVYGTASPTPASLTVAGTHLTAPILVSAPTGFEVSQTTGGTTGYATTQTLAATSGTVSPTTVYLRLTASTGAGSYVGNVVCSSAGAASLSVPVTPSTVAARPLLITAHDRTKTFGTAFTPGTSAFTTSGLVPGQTISSVTLTAVGGTETFAAAGSYAIVASNAAGGTFLSANYHISYEPGTLHVTAPDFAAWAGALADPAPTADPDGDGIVNLLEYYFGLDAASHNTFSPALELVTDGTELIFDYRRNKAAVGITGTVEATTSLASDAMWSSAEVASDVLLTDFDLYETRRATVAVNPGETQKFVRLRVSQP